MTPLLPVTLISGYLGAGKTTLVNQMLRQAAGTRIAVLVNEFGELPIDEDLIEARDDDLISIAGGCICCSFGSDLTAALQTLAEMEPRPDHIVIEASGVALPASIANTVDLLPVLRMEGICVLADSLNIQKMLQDEYIGDTIERQLMDSDLIVLTKSDLVPAAQLENLTKWVSHKWPSSPLVVADKGKVPNSVLLGTFTPQQVRATAAHADSMYDSVVLQFDAPSDASALARALSNPALGVVRAKGYVPDLSGRPALVQLAGQRSEVSFPDDTGAMGIICIGLKNRFDRAAILDLALQGAGKKWAMTD